jgi:hypothetical protein
MIWLLGSSSGKIWFGKGNGKLHHSASQQDIALSCSKLSDKSMAYFQLLVQPRDKVWFGVDIAALSLHTFHNRSC